MIVKGAKGIVKLFTPSNAAKVLKDGKATLAPEATTAQREAVKKLQTEAAKKRMEQAGYTKTDAAKNRDAAKAGETPKPTPVSSKVPTGAKVAQLLSSIACLSS
jgi:hypothetical protein